MRWINSPHYIGIFRYLHMHLLQKTLLALALLFVSPFSWSQTNAENCRQIDRVVARLGEIHYKPVEITGAVKAEIVELYLNELDDRNRIFSTDQVKKIAGMATNEGLCVAFQESKKQYYKGIQRYDSLLHVFGKTPVKFQKGEKIQVNSVQNQHLRKSDAQIKNYLLQLMKYSYLNIAYGQSLDDSLAFTSEKNQTAALDLAWREKLVKREEVFLERLRGDTATTNKKMMDQFLNSIALRFDPHSSFFSNEAMNSFEDELSRETTSFGVQLAENENFEIEVTGVLPGSAAWVSGEFTEGDILESIVTPKKEKIELSFKGMGNLSKYMKNPLYQQLHFNLRKKSGEKISVKLEKTVIENVDNAFKGYVMEQKGVKLGYIELPSFYTNFESDAQLGCANDVAKEILLLKKDGINGLVLDLRNNGGGSLKEAVELCGLFISEGPVCMLQSKNEKPYVLKDMNRGTVYDGPLIVLVNGLSASASEAVAGCLQDYNRALIVGDVTFGKGSAQTVYPVNAFANPNFPDPAGYLKITDGKFYQVSSRSNQVLGIVPDILMKDVYGSVDFFKEKNTHFHLANDSVDKKLFYARFPVVAVPEIQKNRQASIDGNVNFRKINAFSDSLKIYVEKDQYIPLEFIPFMKYIENKEAFMERMDTLSELTDKTFEVRNTTFNEKMLGLNAVEKKINGKLIESMKNDLFLQETISIYRDFYTFDSK